MCTLVFAWQQFPETPTAVGANRDERLDREATPPRRRPETPAVVAPRDERAGGTWIGYNDDGMFAAVTNRWIDATLERERSRGLLVSDVLSQTATAEAIEFVTDAVASDAYDAFNLVIADDETARYLEWDGDLRVRSFDPGIHVVVNVGRSVAPAIPSHRQDAGREQAKRATLVREALETTTGGIDGWLDRAGAVLGDHDYGACIHGDGFGTRSSSLVALGERNRYLFADGPPCRTPYEPVGTESHI